MNALVDYYCFQQLSRAREYMREHFNERLTLELAAEQAYLSPYHFHRMFRRAFGENPHQYLTRLRLEHARELLRQRDLTVSDICFEAGYESLGSFSTLFSRHEGCSPSEFRKVYAMPQMWLLKSMPACMRPF